MPFPGQVNVQPALGVEGDFASINPRAFVDYGAGGLVAGANGVYVGRFAWWDNATNGTVSNSGSGPVTGFVHRAQQGLNVTGPGIGYVDGTLYIPPGFPVALLNAGDVFVRNSGANEVLPGMNAYANYATGLATFAVGLTAGLSAATAATSTIAAGTAIAGTAYITNNVLTVLTSTGGTIYPGAIITGGTTATGTQIVSQISGTTGGVGTYYVSIPEQAVGSAATPFTLAGTYGVLTLGGAPSAPFNPGDVLSGTGVTAGTVLWQLLTGGGGAGSTYVVSPSQTTASTTITAALNVATKFVAMSSALPGELVKISSWLLG